jgi:hypothetical protein
MTASSIPNFTLNNGVQIPVIGLGVFQTPPAETTAAVLAAFETGYRHIDTAAAYGNERGLVRPYAAPAWPARTFHRDQGVGHRLRLRRDAARLRQGSGQARYRDHRPAAPAPAAHRGLRSHDRGVSGAGEAARRRSRARDRRQQLHPEDPRALPAQGYGRAGREPDRTPPVLHAGCQREGQRRRGHPYPGVVADRRHHPLLRLGGDQHVHRQDPHGHR